MEQETIFEKIVTGAIPATKVYEDDRCLAFLDIQPVTIGHLLLIPKTRYAWLQDIPDELLGHLFAKAALLMRAQKIALSCDYVQVEVVGKEVPHVHIHLIPRMMADDLLSRGHASYEHSDHSTAVAAAITAAIATL